MKLALLFFLTASFFFLGPQAAKTSSKASLTTKELKQLIATAKSPEDHRRIAAYYQGEARKLDAKKEEHTEMGAEYDKNPQRYPSKLALGQHCRNLAGYYGLAEQKALELAGMHEEIAKRLETPAN
jgi:hypothetical protein